MNQGTMLDVAVGSRVAAVSADMKTFLGYGVYQGDLHCPELAEYKVAVLDEMIIDCHENDKEPIAMLRAAIISGESLLTKNPCIYLDDGSIIWGCNCWWGTEDSFKQSSIAAKLGVAK